jgi:hypothetical protein
MFLTVMRPDSERYRILYPEPLSQRILSLIKRQGWAAVKLSITLVLFKKSTRPGIFKQVDFIDLESNVKN